MVKGWLTASATLLSLLATPAMAAMLRGETENFIIYSEGSESSLRKHAETLEQFDTALRRIYAVQRQPTHQKLVIYLLPTAADVSRLAAGTRRGNLAGWFVAHTEGSFAVSNRETWSIGKQSAAQRVLLHEYMHFFQMRYLPAALPAWLTEGLAEYYSTMEFERDGVTHVGKPPWDRAYSLLEMPALKSEVLLFSRTQQLSRDAVTVFYARAWLLTHMANHHPEWKPRYAAYVQALNKGQEPKAAAAEHLGDLDALDDAMAKYLRGKISYSTLREPVPRIDNMKVTTLSGVEEALVMPALERRSVTRDVARVEAVSAKLKAVVARYPQSAEARYEVVRSLNVLGNLVEADDEARAAALRTEAEALIDEILAIDPQHSRANLLKAAQMVRALTDKDDATEAEWKAARSHIVRANRASPEDPLPLIEYFNSFTREGREPPSIAFNGVEQAFASAPENELLRVSYAWSLAHAGDFDRAEAAVQVMANNPHGGQYGEAVLERLRAMRKAGRVSNLDDLDPPSDDDME